MPSKEDIRVAWLSGSKTLRKELFAKVKAKVGEHEEVRVGGDVSIEQLQSIVMGGDCFGTKRLVVVEDIGPPVGSRETQMKEFKRLVERIPEECFLLFYGINVSDFRALSTHVAKFGKVWELDDVLTPDGAIATLTRVIQEAGKTIEPNEAGYLIKTLSPENPSGFETKYRIDEVMLVADKIVTFTDKRKVVTREDVVAVASSERPATVWNVLDAYDGGDFDDVYEIVQRLVEQDGNVTSSTYEVLGRSLWKFRILLFLKELQAGGLSGRDLITQGSSLLKLKQAGVMQNMSFTADGPAYTERWVSNTCGMGYGPGVLHKYTRGRLIRIVEALQEAIEQCRYLTDPSQHRLLLDTTLMVICEKMDDTRRKRIAKFFEGCNEV